MDAVSSRILGALAAARVSLTAHVEGSDLSRLLAEILDAVVESTSARSATLSVMGPHDRLEVLAAVGSDAPVHEVMDESLRKLLDEQASAADAPPTGLRWRWVPYPALDGLQVAHTPLAGEGGQTVGVLSVVSEHDAAELGDLGLLRDEAIGTFGALAAVAIADDAQRRRFVRQQSLDRAVHSVVAAARRRLDLNEQLAAAVEALRSGVRSHGVWIRAFDSPDSVELRRYSASYPPETDAMATDALLAIAGRASRACWRLQEATILVAAPPRVELGRDGLERHEPLTSAADVEYIYRVMEAIGASSLLMAPLGAAGTCQGFIALSRSADQEPFSPAEAEAAMSIGRELGASVAQGRLHERQRLLVRDLQDADRYKDQFVATVAHQLKTPLTAVLGHVEMLQEAGADSFSLRSIARAAERMRVTVQDLLTLSEQRGQRPLEPTEIDLSEVVLECAEMLDVAVVRRRQRLDVTRVEAGVKVLGSRDDLGRLVDNLAGNAVKYTPEGGAIELSLREEGSTAVFECRDNGRGIPLEEQQGLFEEFARSSSPEVRALPGSGLGLAIVRRIVERYGGRVELESEVGAGSLFRVLLPTDGSGAEVPAPS